MRDLCFSHFFLLTDNNCPCHALPPLRQIGTCVSLTPRATHFATIDEVMRFRTAHPADSRPQLSARVEAVYCVRPSSTVSSSSLVAAGADEVRIECRLLATPYEARLAHSKAAEMWRNELVLLPATLTIGVGDIVEMAFCVFTDEVFISNRDLDARLAAHLERAKNAHTASATAQPFVCRLFVTKEKRDLLPYAHAQG